MNADPDRLSTSASSHRRLVPLLDGDDENDHHHDNAAVPLEDLSNHISSRRKSSNRRVFSNSPPRQIGADSSSSDHHQQHADLINDVHHEDYQQIQQQQNTYPRRQKTSSLGSKHRIWTNFVVMSVLFSANHGAMVSCISFATLHLGSTGAWELSLLHLIYAVSAALFGTTSFVKWWGSKLGMVWGMALYSVYVLTFWLALRERSNNNGNSDSHETVLNAASSSSSFDLFLSLSGAILGGLGGSIVWVAQGCYFASAAGDYAWRQVTPENDPTMWLITSEERTNTPTNQHFHCDHNNNTRLREEKEKATSTFAGVFAFVYLLEEVVCKLLSWVLLEADSQVTWDVVVGIYTAIAIVSTIGMLLVVHNYSSPGAGVLLPPAANDESIAMTSPHQQQLYSCGYKLTEAWQLLWTNPKMKYMVGLNATFGFAMPFVNAFVNGEVVHRVIQHDDTHLQYVGFFSAMSAGVAAMCSLVFGRYLAHHKGFVLIMGSIAFIIVAIPFLIRPQLSDWGSSMLTLVYCSQGVGRATFEGALRAVFADTFPNNREGAFGNIILQNGLFTSLGFVLSFYFPCYGTNLGIHASQEPTILASSLQMVEVNNTWVQRGQQAVLFGGGEQQHYSPYCVQFKEGGYHNLLVLELAVVVSGVLAILGYWKASSLPSEAIIMGQGEDHLSLTTPSQHAAVVDDGVDDDVDDESDPYHDDDASSSSFQSAQEDYLLT